MSWKVEPFTTAEIAEAIADTDTYYIGLRELEIDTADYSARDGSFTLEGYVLDDDGNKHYVEAFVRVESVSVDPVPYEWEDDYDEEEDEND